MATSATKEKAGIKKEAPKIFPKKYFSKWKKPLVTIPNLVKDQMESFNWFVEKGIKEVFDEFSAINDTSGKKFKFEFLGFEIEEPKYDEYYAKEKKLSYRRPSRPRSN